MKILAYGGQVTAIGLLTVFAVLFLIILFIYGMSAIFRAIFSAKDKKAPAPAPAPAPVIAPAPVAEQTAPEEEEEITDPQIIAVIAAAIAAYDTKCSLVIRSVKRAPGWKKAARDEAVSRF